MAVTVVCLWRGIIPIDWLVSFGYPGIFFLSLVNGVAPVAGPSQIATFFAASQLNPFAVGVAAGVGGAIGELAGYGFGYFLRGSQSDESQIGRITNWRFFRVSREHSFIPLLVLASIPNPLFDPVSAIAGSLRIGIARYFFPVLLGKIIRHLAIAYAGYYSINMDISTVVNNTQTIPFIDSFVFVPIVLCVALIAWIVRSFLESEPDPLVLNFTFFAFAGQCILTADLVRNIMTAESAIVGKQDVIVLVLFLPAVILLFLQVNIVGWQVDKTRDYYEKLLAKPEHNIGNLPPDKIEHWAAVLVRITGVDFFPQFYTYYIKLATPRDKRRKQAVSILPEDKFKIKKNTAAEDIEGINANSLIIHPEEDRKLLWQFYVWTCVASWLVFVGCIIVARWRL